MTDYLHLGKTTTVVSITLEPTFKLLNVIKQKQWQKLSFRSWPFHDNAPAHKSLVAQQALCNCEVIQLNHPAYSPDLAPSNYFLIRNLKCNQSSLLLFTNAAMTINLIYRRWWITVDRCEGMVAWPESQNKKIIFSGHKHQVWYNMLTFYSQVAKLFDRPSYVQ